MIHYVTGNLLAASDEALINTVNTVGVMGKGIALQFKDRYPYNFQVYQQACKEGSIFPGKLLVTRDSNLSTDSKWIINFPTKKDWKHRSKYEYIEEGLKDLVRVLDQYRIKSIDYSSSWMRQRWIGLEQGERVDGKVSWGIKCGYSYLSAERSRQRIVEAGNELSGGKINSGESHVAVRSVLL